MEQKVKYAQEQYAWLKAQGIKNRLRLSRIFKAAGPGQLQDAWKLSMGFLSPSDQNSEKLVACTEDETFYSLDKEVLECTLWGILRTKMDPARAKGILNHCGYHVPNMDNKRTFLRVIEGALEILSPGSFRFSKEEMDQIRDGLRKRMDGSSKNQEDNDDVEYLDD